jgi:hypothetical protein
MLESMLINGTPTPVMKTNAKSSSNCNYVPNGVGAPFISPIDMKLRKDEVKKWTKGVSI